MMDKFMDWLLESAASAYMPKLEEMARARKKEDRAGRNEGQGENESRSGGSVV